MATHARKIWPKFFDALLYGGKTCEVRKNDEYPSFAVGGNLLLQEWGPDADKYTDLEAIFEITHVLHSGTSRATAGIREGYVVLSLKRIPGTFKQVKKPGGEMNIQTVKTDEKGTRVLADYDAIREWIERIEIGFFFLQEDINPFAFPAYKERELPHEIFKRASDEERAMMFGLLAGAVISANRNIAFYKRGERELVKMQSKPSLPSNARLLDSGVRFLIDNPDTRE